MTGTCLTTFLGGDMLKGLACVWTNVPGLGEWFYPLLVVGLQVAIYGKSQNINTTLSTGLLFSVFMVGAGLFTGSSATVMQLPIFLFILNFAGLIAKAVFKK